MAASSRRNRVSPSGPSSNKVRNIIIGGVIVAGFVGLMVLVFLSTRPPASIQGLVQHPRPSRGHDNNTLFSFGELPPVGGTHYDRWQNCGIYADPVDTGHAVHSMEHGAVWITYQPDLPADEVAQLQNIVRGQTYLLLSPYPQQRSPVVLTAWGLQLEVDSAADRRIGQFIERYRVGPQTPERGAVCTGGVGEPVS